jgi:methanogenic corrinoid protein MtbC1
MHSSGWQRENRSVIKERDSNESKAAIYNIKAVVAQTGLNPATIRAWERRYGLPIPQRTRGGHRQYSQRDVDTLNWLIARQDEGMSISHAVELWKSLLDKEQDPLQREQAEFTSAPRVQISGEQVDELRRAWVAACLAFDRETAEQVIAHAFALFPPETVCFELLQEALVEIGEGWHRGQISVQQEHFTSALSEQRLEMLIAAQPTPTRSERIIVAAAPGEFHIFGPLLLTYLLRRQGWDVIYLGADVPAGDLDSTINQLQPQLVIVSAQLLHTASMIKDMARHTYAQNVLLAYGGRIFNELPQLRQQLPGYFLGETLPEAVQMTAQLLSQPPAVIPLEQPDESYRHALAHYSEQQALIESQVWDTLRAADKPIEQLAAISGDLSQMIVAALKLEDMTLLGSDMAWVAQQLMSYHLAQESIVDFMQAYYRAAENHLNGSARVVVQWLAQLVA